MHYGWPLLRNLTLLSILTQWYSNNRKFRYNIQTASFSPRYYFVPQWLSTEMCFPDAFLGSSHGTMVLAGGGIWCTGRLCPALCRLSAEDGAEFFTKRLPKELQRKRLRRLEELPPKHRWMLCLIRSQIISPRGVPWEWWRELECLDINWRSSPRVWENSREKQQEESRRRAKHSVSRSFTMLC